MKKLVIASLMVLAPGLALAESTAVPSLPVTSRPIVAEYQIYVGGVHFVDATAYVNLEAKKYHMMARAQTIGLWGRWFPWETSVESEGVAARDSVQPLAHKAVSTWKHKPKTMLLNFDEQGAVAIAPESTDAPAPQDRLADDVVKDTVDPLSGVLQLMAHYTIHDDCDSATSVFDGKRRFDLLTADLGTVQLRDNELSVFSGSARKCELRFKLIAGQRKDMEQRAFWQTDKGRENRPPFTIWLAKLRPDLPPMPVMAETKSPFGYVMIYLKSWAFENQPRPSLLTVQLARQPLDTLEAKPR